MGKKDEDEGEGKRVTVLFNARHWRAIEAQVKAQTAERGYSVSVSDSLRELVDTQWCGEA